MIRTDNKDKTAPMHRPPDEEDSRVIHALEEYLEVREAGKIPGREEFLARHSDVVGQLASCLDGLDFVHAMAPQMRQQTEAGDGEQSADKQPRVAIGDFRIVCEIGRGGMGVVYEAEQLSLGRTVALKVLPFASMLDDRQLKRFKNEARAAATLDHPNIVSVYGTGEERGVHYYAMQLIQGQNMAQVIDELKFTKSSTRRNHSANPAGGQFSAANSDRKIDHSDGTEKSPPESREDPTARVPQAAISTVKSVHGRTFFQDVAKLGIQAADALEHAHENGVLHRDIKPANLMLDARGNLLITDFGLARIESDAGMTMSGDLLGTLRYMSPEQVLGKPVAIDQRTDIYSLCATLYEMLTLEPLFGGNDRQELMRQIAFEEPRPLRKLNPSVPSDLETIVLKGIEKSPENRYDTSRQLADDLQRFLDDKPIHARRPSLWQRSTKLARRHQPIVVSAVVILLLATVGLAISSLLLAQQRNLADAARDSEQQQRVDAEVQRDEARRQRDESERQRQRAEENFRRAREAVDKYLTSVSENELLNVPAMQPLRKDLLELALEYYQQFIAERPDDPELQAEFATAYSRVGEITKEIGHTEEARDAHQKALEFWKTLANRYPQDADTQDALAKSYFSVGEFQPTWDETIAYLEKAIAVAKPLVKPAHRKTLGKAYLYLGKVKCQRFVDEGGTETMDQALGALENAEGVFRELTETYPEVTEYQWLLADVYVQFGNWHSAMLAVYPSVGRQKKEAQAFFQRGLQIRERIANKDPEDIGAQRALAASYSQIGKYEKASEIVRKLARENPAVNRFQEDLTIVYTQMAVSQEQAGKFAESFASRQAAIDIFKKLVDRYPENNYEGILAAHYDALGTAQRAAGRPDEAVASYKLAISILAEHSIALGRLVDAYSHLGKTLESVGNLDQAIAALKSAVEAGQELIEKAPNQLHYRFAVTWNYQYLGKLQRKAGELEAALTTFENALQVLQKAFVEGRTLHANPAHLPEAGIALADYRREIVRCLTELERPDDLEKFLREQISTWKTLQEELPHQSLCLIQRLALHLRLADSLRQSGGAAEAENHFRNALEIFEGVSDERGRLDATVTCLALHDPLPSSGSESNDEETKFYQAVARRLKPAIEVARRVVQSDPAEESAWDAWNLVALAHYRRLNWEGAEVEAELAVQLAANEPNRMMGIVPLFLLAGKEDEYREVCDQLMDDWERWSGNDLWDAAAMCTLDPLPPRDPELLLSLVQRAVEEGPDWSSVKLTRSYIRMGEYEQAIEDLMSREAIDSEPNLQLSLAIAHHHAGHRADARAWLEKAEHSLTDWDAEHANARMECEALRHEAERLILGENRDPQDLTPVITGQAAPVTGSR